LIYSYCAILEHAFDHLGVAEGERAVGKVFTGHDFRTVTEYVKDNYLKGERVTTPTETLDSEIARLLGVEA
jgi:hypothetical protein